MEALVLGAAGFVGLHLVDALLELGIAPRCGRRRRTNVLVLRKRPVPLVRLDLDDPDSLIAAMTGCDVVFHAAGHYPTSSLDPATTLETGIRQTRHVLDAAAKTGVKRLVFVSSTGSVAATDSGPSDESHIFATPPDLGLYHRLKWEMERLVLAEDRVQTTIACPGACLGPWDLRVGTCAPLVGLARGLDPAHPDGVVNPVDVGDVATALVRLAVHPNPPQRVLLAGSNWRLHDLLVSLAPRYGVPTPSPALSRKEAFERADSEERRAAAGEGRAMLTRALADLIVHGVPVQTGLAEAELSMEWTPLADTLDRFDLWARRLGIIGSELAPYSGVARTPIQQESLS